MRTLGIQQSAFKRIGLVLIVMVATTVLAADRPQIVNGKLVEQASSGDLAKDVAAISGPAWVGYSVPVVAGEHVEAEPLEVPGGEILPLLACNVPGVGHGG